MHYVLSIVVFVLGSIGETVQYIITELYIELTKIPNTKAHIRNNFS